MTEQAKLLEDDIIQKDTKVTTSDLTHRLYRKFDTSEDAITNKYIVATQVRIDGGTRTADAMIVGNWRSANYEIQGFEIKVSRSDWLNEIKSPAKSIATKKYCNRWWLLIASESMYKLEEVPEDWGIMVAHGSNIRVVRKAPLLDPEPLTVQFITGLLRANKRGHVPEDVHAQYIADNNRAVEAKLRKEFDDLKQFVKFIHEAFGIQLMQNKRWDVNSQKDIKEWVAKVRNNWKNHTPQELKQLIELALNSDLNKVKQDLEIAYGDVKRAMTTLENYKGRNY